MKLIEPSWEIIEQKHGIQGIYEIIEIAGRNCYKSTKSKDKTSEDFINMLIKRGHTAMLEHGTIYLTFPYDYIPALHPIFENPYVEWEGADGYIYLTTNYRTLFENDWVTEFIDYVTEPTEFHHKRVTVKFIADIHFYKDCTRHRHFSWAIESTRFCNYLKEKFGMSVSFMKPTWIKKEDISELEHDCKVIESIYFKWINKGYQAQHAAYFLPQGTKAEVIMTGFISDYQHFFNLRAIGTTGIPHPDIKALVEPLMHEFIKRNYING